MMSLLCAAISFVPTLRTPAPPAAARLPVVTMMERRAFALGAAALLSNAPFDLAAAPAEEEQPNPEAEALRAILKETVGQKKY